ncbi:RNase adapter RapZ [Deinococcus pimensis]|uniref:RNase adapter RapZ n=1 Tax=Deinococcus pimensis TaxID=309888 RepID=UPI000481481F|nr:RNase adapter RapZ [Deinococcus pimensis]
MKYIVLSGLSGAGKNTALRALEDAGFLTLDNLPPQLWSATYDLARTRGQECVVVCTDARTRAYLTDVEGCWEDLRRRGGVRLVYLEASDEVLLQRYNLTRRAHPLGEPSLMLDFQHERDLLGVLRERADNVIDTTLLSARDLAERVLDIAGTDAGFDLRLLSFGFKHAPPRDADLVLDVRSLPNPYYVPELRDRTGLETDVAAHVFSEGDDYYERVLGFVRDSAERARASGRRSYNVAVGCTGGRHRSVAVTERLSHDLADLGARVTDHRDVTRGEHA